MQTNSPFLTEKLISLKIRDIGLSSSSGEFKISFCSAPHEKVPCSGTGSPHDAVPGIRSVRGSPRLGALRGERVHHHPGVRQRTGRCAERGEQLLDELDPGELRQQVQHHRQLCGYPPHGRDDQVLPARCRRTAAHRPDGI